MFLAIAINSPPRSLLINLVQEKSERFKETQKVVAIIIYPSLQIMGMQSRAYEIGWIIYGYGKTIVVSAVFL